jgi:murein DD-endopeptidase MepM/ murein hydrolase activator NlpD
LLLIILSLLVLGLLIWKFFFEKKVNQKIDDFTYQLPYKKGESYKIVQGYGGWFSHNGIAALDFEMPIGTPILAARAGVVYGFKDNNTESGITASFKNKANYIMIKHNDGTIGCYWHLKQNGVVKKQGTVKQGEIIGYSGNTGLCVQPHLHFSVKAKLNYLSSAYLQTRFYTNKGIEILKQGNYYSY